MPVSTTPLSDNTFLLIREETNWAVWATAKTTVAVPFYGGNFSLRPESPDREQPHVDGNDETTFLVTEIRDLTGTMEVGLFPTLAKKILDWAVYRSGSPKKGKSHTTTIVYPGLFARRAYGVMVNTMTINFADNDDVKISLDLIGQYEEMLTGASIPVVGTYTWPGTTSITFLNCRFLFSLDDLATEIVPVGLESGQITYNNNLVIGPHVEDRILTYKDGVVEYVREGKREISGNIVVLLDRTDIPYMMQQGYDFSLRLMGAHKAGNYTTVAAPGFAPGSPPTADVNITVANSAGFVIGDVVRFDTAITANRSVATITNVPDGTHITVDYLDKAVATGDYVFNDAVEIEVAKARVTSIEYDHSPGQLVKATINFKGVAELPTDILLAYQAPSYVP